MRKTFILVLICFVKIAFSQSDTLRLFFAINQDVSESNLTRLDSLLNILPGASQIKILGYADFLHSNDYNLQLSQRRADRVKDYLLTKKPSIKIILCKGLGEKFSKDNLSNFGDAFFRRVDVIFNLPSAEKPSEKNVVKEEVKEERVSETITDSFDNMISVIEGMTSGEKLAIEGLNFVPGRHFITKASVPVLQKLLLTLEKNPKIKIQIQGHVCCTDGQADGYDYDTHDRKLSENRARAIHDYLISKGINRNRLSYKGFGHSQPKFPLEKTPEEEQANRRVEIMMVEK